MNFKNNLKGSAILAFAALIWGLAFVAQSVASDYIPPMLFTSLRSLIGVLFLVLLLFLRKAIWKTPVLPTQKQDRKKLWIAGSLCGIFLTISVNLQQFGLSLYPEGAAAEARAGFLTALYVILVPLLSVLLGKRLRLPLICAVVIAMGGIYMLCLSGGLDAVYLADLLVFLCAISFTLHIFVIDRFGQGVDGMLLSSVQFLVCGILSGILALLFEPINLSPSVWLPALPAMLYTGILSSGVAYTLQIVGQKFAEPTVASLTMSLESVFAALGGWLIMGNSLSWQELLGCVLVFGAIVLAQLPEKKKA